MIRRTSQLAKRFTHNHNHNNITPNVFLPKNNYKIDSVMTSKKFIHLWEDKSYKE